MSILGTPFSELQPLDEANSESLIALLSEHFLEWLEVMSLTRSPFYDPLTLLKPPPVRPPVHHNVACF